MKRVPVIRTITTTALTDPRPRFVTLTKRGANQTPWARVKSAEIIAATPAPKPQPARKASEAWGIGDLVEPVTHRAKSMDPASDDWSHRRRQTAKAFGLNPERLNDPVNTDTVTTPPCERRSKIEATFGIKLR